MTVNKNPPNVFGGEGLMTEGVSTVANEGFTTNGQQAVRMSDGLSTRQLAQHQSRMTSSFVPPAVPALGPKNKK